MNVFTNKKFITISVVTAVILVIISIISLKCGM